MTILNSSSLHPLKFLPALKCSLDFFTILLPLPCDSHTHQKLYLPNFPLPFLQSPLHHFLSYLHPFKELLQIHTFFFCGNLSQVTTGFYLQCLELCNFLQSCFFPPDGYRNVVKNLTLLQLLLILLKSTSTHFVLRRQCLVLLINFLLWLFSP